jgi:hypothetical protein
MLLWSLLVAIFIVCALSALPTKWYARAGTEVVEARRRQVANSFRRELARQSARVPFTVVQDFFAQGVGLALDPAQQLLFVAEREGQGLTSAILPYAALREVTQGERRDSGFYDYYLDLAVLDENKPFWRLLCDENPELAAEVKRVLDEVCGAG